MNRWLLALFVLTVVVNAAAFGFLPDRVAIQFGLTGAVTNTAPKAVFAFISPLVLLAMVVSSRRKRERVPVLAAVIVAIANVTLVFVNLRR